MNALKVAWGLLFDDARLGCGVVATLVIAAVLAYLKTPAAAAIILWLGLIAALMLSILHELKLAVDKRRGRSA